MLPLRYRQAAQSSRIKKEAANEKDESENLNQDKKMEKGNSKENKNEENLGNKKGRIIGAQMSLCLKRVSGALAGGDDILILSMNQHLQKAE